MRDRVKKQIKAQEDIHNKLRWDIEQNNILITFLQGRLEEAQKRIGEMDQEMIQKHENHQKALADLARETEEARLREIAEAKERQVEASVDCPLDRDYVQELLQQLDQAKEGHEKLQQEKDNV